MADNWQVGDLALCVNTARIRFSDCIGVAGEWLVRGRTYEVSGVLLGNSSGRAKEVLHLTLVDGVNTAAAIRFIKVTPPAADEFDRETVALMNRSPAKEPAQ